MAQTVLVTGGTGYVAGWCIVRLLEQGYDVRTTVRSLSKEGALRAAIATQVEPGDRLHLHAADLLSDDGWAAALEGCDYVLHVASPLSSEDPSDPESLIAPARDGALRVLRLAAVAGVQRVVMTSSCAAASTRLNAPDSLTDETLWTDLSDPRLNAYRRSKVLSERAAWDFMTTYDGPMTLTTVLPAAIFGPVLSLATLGSVQVIGRMLEGRMPGLPKVALEVVDVRDLADLHLAAMTAPEAEGERFIASGEALWMTEMAATLRTSLGEQASKVPTRRLPDVVTRFAALFDRELKMVTLSLGRRRLHSADKARRLLGWSTRDARETVVDTGRSLLAAGFLEQAR